MMVFFSITMMVLLGTVNPVTLSILILIISIILSSTLWKMTMTSMLTFIVILVFASGMMILFIYTASLTPFYSNKTKKNKMIFSLLIFTTMFNYMTQKKSLVSLKNFSSKVVTLIMTLVLIMFMVAIAMKSFNPIQTLSTSF